MDGTARIERGVGVAARRALRRPGGGPVGDAQRAARGAAEGGGGADGATEMTFKETFHTVKSVERALLYFI